MQNHDQRRGNLKRKSNNEEKENQRKIQRVTSGQSFSSRVVAAPTSQNFPTGFKKACWMVITRYDTYIGQDEGAGGLHAALPSAVFRQLEQDFGVSVECFASPFNSYFPSYCSAFPDVDGVFGSLGSFFHLIPRQGSFEANPPFSEELMDRMVDHMEDLLGQNPLGPLSFAVVLPHWEDNSAHQRLCQSSFLRETLVIPAKQHFYKSGLQHKETNNNNILYKAVHATCIFFLQNDHAYSLWKPTKSKLDRLVDAFSIQD